MRKILFLVLITSSIMSSCGKENVSNTLPDSLSILSQEDLELFKDQLLEIDTFNGNISLGIKLFDTIETKIFDLSAFANISAIKGDLTIGDIDAPDLLFFSKLKNVCNIIILDNSSLEIIAFPTLEYAKNISIANNINLKSIELPQLHTIENSFEIINNKSLLKVKNNDELNRLSQLIVQGNVSLIEFMNLQSLRSINQNFNIDLYSSSLSPNFLSELQFLGKLELTIWKSNVDLAWLGNVDNYGGINIKGEFSLSELCPLFEFCSLFPNLLIANSYTDDEVYFSSNVVEICD